MYDEDVTLKGVVRKALGRDKKIRGTSKQPGTFSARTSKVSGKIERTRDPEAARRHTEARRQRWQRQMEREREHAREADELRQNEAMCRTFWRKYRAMERDLEVAETEYRELSERIKNRVQRINRHWRWFQNISDVNGAQPDWVSEAIRIGDAPGTGAHGDAIAMGAAMYDALTRRQHYLRIAEGILRVSQIGSLSRELEALDRLYTHANRVLGELRQQKYRAERSSQHYVCSKTRG